MVGLSVVELALQGGQGVVERCCRLRVTVADLVPRVIKRGAVELRARVKLAEGLRRLVALLVQPDVRAALLVAEGDAE